MSFYRPSSWLAVFVVILLSSLTGHGAPIEASPDWRFRAWQTDDGLPDNSVTGVAQTADGYLWVATHGGLLRYNGSKFEPMPLLEMQGFPNRVIRHLLLDRRGRTWLGMERGAVVCLKPDGIQIFGVAEGLPGAQILAMAEDGDGAVWAAFPEVICRIMDGKCEFFGAAEGLPRGGGHTTVASDSRGDLWFARGRQVGCFRDGKLAVKLELGDTPVRICAASSSGLWISSGDRLFRYQEGQIPKEQGNLPENIMPRVLFEDRSGALWIGTAAEGLFRLKDGGLDRVPTSHPAVDCIGEDREGNIWAGTNGGGLNQLRPSVMALITREDGLAPESVRSVCEDKNGGLWSVMQTGLLSRRHEGQWVKAGSETGWSGGEASCVTADAEGGVWVGTRDDGLRHLQDGTCREWRQKSGLASDSVRSILSSASGILWVATDGPSRLQGIRDGRIFDVKTPAGIRSIRAMAEGADGVVWIATSEGLILRLSGESLVPELGITEKKPISVRSLQTTPDGALWIGYAGFGMGRLKEGRYARITMEHGLSDDYVSQILADNQGGLWITGNSGLSQVRLSELADVAEGRASRLRSRVFGRSEGLSSLQANYDNFPTVCRAQNGRLLMAMRTGLLMIQPEKIRDNHEPPPVVIEVVAVNDQTVAVSENRLPLQRQGAEHATILRPSPAVLRVTPDHRKLEFEFAALSYASPENVHFRYRLSNFDKGWVEAGTRRSATYPQLPAGDYGFRVIACNNAGVWNETGASFAFVVTPFFWQTWWFRGIALLLFTTGIIASVRYVSFRRLRKRMLQLKEEAALHQERARIARDMHDEVGAKLTRLFLLTEMAGGQPELSAVGRSDMREISDTARETILAFDEVLWAVNPRNDTLGDLVNYLCRHTEEFLEGSPTQWVFDLPLVIPSVMLPTEVRHQVFLAAKEALNNVLKHAKAHQVCLRLILHSTAFELVIHDDGTGFDPGLPSRRHSGGNGLGNMQERIRGLGGRFECDIQPGQGTRISFLVPIAPTPSNE